MSRDATRRAGRALVALLAVLTVATGCTPLDDAMVAIFGRSMRDSRSFDPYENTIAPPENSVPFAAGNFPSAPGRLNTGQPEPGPGQPGTAGARRFERLIDPVHGPVPLEILSWHLNHCETLA